MHLRIFSDGFLFDIGQFVREWEQDRKFAKRDVTTNLCVTLYILWPLC